MGMNILILGLQVFSAPLRALGHAVIGANSAADADMPLEHPVVWQRIEQALQSAGFVPDAVLYVDNGNLPFLLDPYAISCPTVYYSIDTYCNPWHVPYAHTFDLACVAQKDFVPLFQEAGQDARWLPLFSMLRGEERPFAERRVPVSFVGTLEHKNNPDRKPFLETFNSLLPLRFHCGDFRPVFADSKIVLNQTAFSEINFRCFEAMALGAALLMEKCGNGMDELFSPGENILPTYTRNNAAEAARIASIYLKRPRALAEIAANGRRLVTTRHDAASRARTLLEMIDGLRMTKKHSRRLGAIQSHHVHARVAFAMLAAELNGEKLRPYRDFFLDLATR